MPDCQDFFSCQGELKRKAADLEESKEQLKEQYTQLSMRIEHLELANEELVKEHSNSKLDQALKEVARFIFSTSYKVM